MTRNEKRVIFTRCSLPFTRYSLLVKQQRLAPGQKPGTRRHTSRYHPDWPRMVALSADTLDQSPGAPEICSSNIARPDNGGVSGAAYSPRGGCNLPRRPANFRCSTPRPIRRHRGCLALTIGGSLNPGLPVTTPVHSHCLSINGKYAIGIRRCQTAGKYLNPSPKIDIEGRDVRIFLMPTSLRLSPNRVRFCTSVWNISRVNLVFGYWLTDTPAQM